MNKDLLKLFFLDQADIWLKENPLLLNEQEKDKFIKGLMKFIENYSDNQTSTIEDEVFDFLVQRNLIESTPREDSFLKYLTEKYKKFQTFNILDVGAGRICSLSKAMVEKGAKVTAIDANIRLTDSVLKKANITAIKEYFQCDEFSANNKGTNVDKYNLIVGLEPCDATEHIIRQCLKYDKPFDIHLCAAPHKSLDGKEFKTCQDWYEHLSNISNEVKIIDHHSGYIATNNKFIEI